MTASAGAYTIPPSAKSYEGEILNIIENEMIMHKCEVNIEKFRWPAKCAYCYGEANTSVMTRTKAVKSFGYYIFLFTTTSRVIEIRYPVCKNHKLKAQIASKLAERNLLNLGLGVISIFFIIRICRDIFDIVTTGHLQDMSPGWRAAVYIYPALYWSLFLWARKNSPILLTETKDKVFFQFRNEKFYREFQTVNRPSEKNPDREIFDRIDSLILELNTPNEYDKAVIRSMERNLTILKKGLSTGNVNDKKKSIEKFKNFASSELSYKSQEHKKAMNILKVANRCVAEIE